MPTHDELDEMVRVRESLAEIRAAKGFGAYLDEVVINCLPEPKRFGLVMDPWQRDITRRLVPAVNAVAGYGGRYDGPLNFFVTMPRGHDKTGLIGRTLNWLLCFSKRRLSIATAAADTDQAGLILESMVAESRLNPWIKARVKYGDKHARGPGGSLRVLSADAPTSYGLNCDVYVCDELTHWKKPDLWGTLWSGREKRAGSLFFIITNAGVKRTWQHLLLLGARDDPSHWSVYEVPVETWLATWMSADAVARLRAMLPPVLARRVLGNEWIDPAEESGFLSREDVLACEAAGRERKLGPCHKGVPGLHYFCGIDYGPLRDRTAMAVVHYDPADRVVVLDRLDVLQGSEARHVPIRDVAAWIDQANREFVNPTLVVDPYQMEGTIQHYEIRQPVKRFEARGGKSNYEMAECMRSLVANRQLLWYAGAGRLPSSDGREDDFSEELLNLVTRTTMYGYRFDHTAAFHDDRACAVGMAALFAAEDLRTGLWVSPTQLDNRPSLTPFRPGSATGPGCSVWGVPGGRDTWERRS